MSDRKRRLNFVVSVAVAERLERLRELTDASSEVEVFRSALKLYEALIDETKKGNKLVRQMPDGSQVDLPIFW